ncbi:hypothetical protein [Paenibacillus lutrae]|uniref:Uncharacterized protein n=1 Tax=Paenibacillus lutrae TaxID=2078573 RepID=A0A7X3FM45_9BACL|nr:hypothetical protein [Paenibacillus lutrae]MVP02133.1 hypothetical protein [Paenibacillus lutrae]
MLADNEEINLLVNKLNETMSKERSSGNFYLHNAVMPGIHALAAIERMQKNDYVTKIFVFWLKEHLPSYYQTHLIPYIKDNQT